MVQRTKAELRSDINSLLPSNNPGGLSAGNLRTVLTNLVDSLVELTDDGPFTFIDTLSYNPDAGFPDRDEIYHLTIPENVSWFLLRVDSTSGGGGNEQRPVYGIIQGETLRSPNNELSQWNSSLVNNPVLPYSPSMYIGPSLISFTYITDTGNKILIPYFRSTNEDRLNNTTIVLFKIN